MSYKKLYPPWYDIAVLLYYTIGQDEGVHILEPECDEEHVYIIGICVDYRQKAEYLRMIIPYTYTSFNTVVVTRISVGDDIIEYSCISQKNQRDVANLFCNALRSNPLFVGVILVPQPFIPIKSEIIINVVHQQLPSLCNGFYSKGVTIADAFAEVCEQCFGHLIQTTARFESEERSCGCQPCYYCIGDFKC